MVVFFALGLGKIENFRLAVFGGSGGIAPNMVTFDLMLFAFLATVIVVLMVVHSVIEYREGGPTGS